MSTEAGCPYPGAKPPAGSLGAMREPGIVRSWRTALVAAMVGVVSVAAPVVAPFASRAASAAGAGDDTVLTFGSAGFYGSTSGKALNQPIVGMANTVSGKGYWLVASDGGI